MLQSGSTTPQPSDLDKLPFVPESSTLEPQTDTGSAEITALADTLARHKRHWTRAITDRLRGPGGLYNIGNFIGLVSGLAFQALSAQAEPGATTAGAVLAAYLFGSPGATALTVAMVFFFISGEYYHRAWAARSVAGPDPRLTRLADLLSGFGALALAGALAVFGDVVLALSASLLLAGGKLGNALSPGGAWPITVAGRKLDLFRIAVPVSRVPAMAALLIEIMEHMTATPPDGTSALKSLILLVCFCLWVRADLLLART